MNGVDLAYVISHWSGAYEINMRQRRCYASRRDDGTVLEAASAAELLDKIREDSAARPVPR